MEDKIRKYIKDWKGRGYKDIPDEVTTELASNNLAPSYKAICLCILNNDHHLKGLGYTGFKSEYYNTLKRIEINARNKQLRFNF